MTTTLDLLNRVRNNLLGARQSNVNVLSVAMPAAPTDGLYGYLISLAYPIEGLAAGTIVGVGAYVFQVTSVNTAAMTFIGILIDRLDTGVSPVAPIGSLVRINPEYTDLAVMRAINEALADMSSPVQGLFTTAVKTFTYNPAITSYDMATGILEVLEVGYDEPGPARIWRIVPRNGYTLKRQAYTTDFASGVALTLTKGGYPGRSVRVIYSTAFVPITAWTAAVTSVLDATVEDIPVLGATARLLGPQEAKRNVTGAQSDTRRAAEVPAGANIGSARWFQTEYMRRVGAEAARNARLWPHRRRTH